jgi:hypothetical protein
MDQAARKISVGKLRVGKSSVMLVTDVAARGIDIPSIDNVINYDYPAKPKLFIHRTGRAARAGRSGSAFSFVTVEDMPYVIDTHLFLSRPLKPAPMPGQGAEGGSQQVVASDAFEKTTWCALSLIMWPGPCAMLLWHNVDHCLCRASGHYNMVLINSTNRNIGWTYKCCAVHMSAGRPLGAHEHA